MVVTCDLTDSEGPLGPGGTDGGERWRLLVLRLPLSFPVFCVECEMQLPGERDGISEFL